MSSALCKNGYGFKHKGAKVALRSEIGYNKKRNQINFTPGMETGFFKKTSRLLELTR